MEIFDAFPQELKDLINHELATSIATIDMVEVQQDLEEYGLNRTMRELREWDARHRANVRRQMG